jgi:hypothetical protein
VWIGFGNAAWLVGEQGNRNLSGDEIKIKE